MLVDATPAAQVTVNDNGARVLQWQAPPLVYGPLTVSDLEVQVDLAAGAFVATYSVTNDSPRARQKAYLYLYFESPSPDAEGFVSAGLLGKEDSPGQLGALPSRCRLYDRTHFPSASFRDMTSRHSLRPGLSEDAEVRGTLRIRGNAGSLDRAAELLAANPPRLRALISVKEDSGRY